MNTLEIWLLAIGLAMDCLAVSIASGILLKRLEWRTMLFMAFCFGLFQAGMPFIGWIGTNSFSYLIRHIDHWIAFGILLYLGGNMVRESFREEEERQEYNPRKLKVILTLAVATSIDALAIGISFACLGIHDVNTLLPSLAIIGWVSFSLSIAGLLFGILCQKGWARKLKAERLGGIILIGIGTKILLEHLFFNG